MNHRVWSALAIAALVITGAAVIGIGAYNAGVAHGVAESSRAIAPPAAGMPYAYGWYGGPRPWGVGFFPFFPIFPVLFFLLVFFLVRGLFWGGPWRRGGWGRGYDGVPPAFDEWHRRAHGDSRPASTPGSPT